MRSGSARDHRIAEVIRAARLAGWDEGEYQLFLLTTPDAEGVAAGHVTLREALPNPRRGLGRAWVRRQRYALVSAIKRARVLGYLEQ